jgi:hypothetical protein
LLSPLTDPDETCGRTSLFVVILSAARISLLKSPRFFTPLRSVQHDMNVQCFLTATSPKPLPKVISAAWCRRDFPFVWDLQVAVVLNPVDDEVLPFLPLGDGVYVGVVQGDLGPGAGGVAAGGAQFAEGL